MDSVEPPPLRAAAHAEMAPGHPSTHSIALVILTVLAVLYTLSVAAAIVLPFLLALVLTLLLAPLNRWLIERLFLPTMLAALLLVILLFAAVSGAVFALAVPAAAWIAKAPQSLQELQHRLGFLGPPVAFLRHGLEQVGHTMQADTPPGQQIVTVQPQSNFGGVGLSVLQGTGVAVGQVFTLAIMLFFMLSAGDSLLRRLVEVLPGFAEKRRAVEIVGAIAHNVSGWLLTITAMNLLVGLANFVQMWAQGMPNPLLWGALAFLVNFIPILGPFTGIVIFFFVGLFSKPALWQAVLPSAIYLAVHLLEGQAVTPLLLARRFTLNPLLVILSLFFWDWLWGVPGAFLSLPLLAIAKIIADRIPALAPLGHLLGGPARDPAAPTAGASRPA